MTDKYRIDGHKLDYHIDRVKEWNDGKQIAPLNIQLGICTHCNINCQFCYPQMQGRSRKLYNMPRESIFRLLKDSKEVGVTAIAFIGEGENTLNPHLYDSLEYAHSINLDVSLATNGVDIKEDKMKVLLESLSWLRINISAATKDSYELVHGADQFDKVIDNIKKLVSIKKQYNLEVPIGLQFVIAEYNKDDIVPFAKLGQELGVDNITLKPVSDNAEGDLNSPLEEYTKMEDLFLEAESFSTDTYDVVIKRSKIKEKGVKSYDKCYGTNFLIGINGRGDIFPCCHFAGVKNKEEYNMGNIIETSFKEIVKSKRYAEIQKKIQEVNMVTGCESNCGHHYINQFLFDIKKGKTNLDTFACPKTKRPCVNFI